MALTRITKGVIKPNENYDTHNINSTGIITAVGANFTGNVSVGGVLTYEDVSSIDAVGIITANQGIHVGAGVSAVGVGTFGSLDISGDIDVDGHTNLDNVSISGVTTASDNIIIPDNKKLVLGTQTGRQLEIFHNTSGSSNHRIQSTSSTNHLNIIAATIAPSADMFAFRNFAGNQNILRIDADNSTKLYFNGNEKLTTENTGVNITGIVTATSADINGDLDVDGHTNLDNVSIAGVTTSSGNITISNTLPTLLLTDTDHNADWSVRNSNGNFTIYDETSSVGRFTINGAGTANVPMHLSVGNSLSVTGNITASGKVTATEIDLNGDLDVDGHTNLDNVSVSGILTATGEIRSQDDIRIQSVYPRLYLTDTDSNDDFSLINNNGSFLIYNDTQNDFRLKIDGTTGMCAMTLRPTADSTYNLGTNTLRWANVYADTLYGDGSNLTGITQTTINSNTNNYLITGTGTANTLQGEANLTFDGSSMTITGSGSNLALNVAQGYIRSVGGQPTVVAHKSSSTFCHIGVEGNTNARAFLAYTNDKDFIIGRRTAYTGDHTGYSGRDISIDKTNHAVELCYNGGTRFATTNEGATFSTGSSSCVVRLTSNNSSVHILQAFNNDLNIKAPSSGGISLVTNGVTERVLINSSGQVKIQSGTVIHFTNTNNDITTDSSDGSDNKRIVISGGGATDSSRGANINLTGNEYSGANGKLELSAGNSGNTNGSIDCYTGGSLRLKIASNGAVSMVTAGSLPATSNETLHVQGEGHNGHGTTNTRSVLNVVGARSSNSNAAGLWIGARTNENTAVIGTRTSSGNLAFETYASGWYERMRIRSDGRILMGIGIPTSGYTRSTLHVESPGVDLRTDYDTDDSQGASPHLTLVGSNAHVRLDMGTQDVGPYASYIQSRYDNDPEDGGTSNSGLEPLMLNPMGGAVGFNITTTNSYSSSNFNSSQTTYGGIIMRAGRANTATVNNTNTAIKIYPAETRTATTGDQNQGVKFGGIAWHGLDPHHNNGSWSNSYTGHHCWMGMSYHSTPGQEKSNWQVQMNNSETPGSFATNVAIQANPQGYVTHPSQPYASTTLNNTTSGNMVTHNTVLTNNGSHFNTSNSRFICPINGFYLVSFMAMTNNSNDTMDIELRKNGSNANNILVPYQSATGSSYNQVSGTCIIECAKNDYLQFKVNNGSIYSGRHSAQCFALLG